MNLPLPDFAPRPPVENVDVAIHRAPISQMAADGEPNPPRPPGIPQRSGRTNFEINETSSNLRPVLGSSRTPSGIGNSNGNHLFSIAHGIHTVQIDNHHMVSTSDTLPEKPRPKAAERRIDEMAEMEQIVLSPFSSDHFRLRSSYMGI